jgi:hypothetical protein
VNCEMFQPKKWLLAEWNNPKQWIAHAKRNLFPHLPSVQKTNAVACHLNVTLAVLFWHLAGTGWSFGHDHRSLFKLPCMTLVPSKTKIALMKACGMTLTCSDVNGWGLLEEWLVVVRGDCFLILYGWRNGITLLNAIVRTVKIHRIATRYLIWHCDEFCVIKLVDLIKKLRHLLFIDSTRWTQFVPCAGAAVLCKVSWSTAGQTRVPVTF